MKFIRVLSVSLVFALLLALSSFATVGTFGEDPYIIDFENFELNHLLAGSEHEGLEEGFYRAVDAMLYVVEKDGSKVIALDNTYETTFGIAAKAKLRVYGGSTTDACKPFASYGSVFTMSYRVFIELEDNASSLIFNDRITDSQDNEGFQVLRLWHNGALESQDGQVAWGFPFGEWVTITNIYDYENETITTYINNDMAFEQALPNKVEGRVDWSDFCYQTLGKSENENNATGMIYLDDIKWESGANVPAADTETQPEEDDTTVGGGEVVAPDNGDVLMTVALLAIASGAVLTLSKKR